MIDKQKIITTLIERKEAVVQELSSKEKAELQDMNQDEQDMKSYVSPEENLITSIIQVNNTIHHLAEQIKILKNIDLKANYETVNMGALVTLDTGYFLVSASFEPIEIEGIKLVGVSTASPIYHTMHGMKKGEKFTIEGHQEEHTILNIL